MIVIFSEIPHGYTVYFQFVSQTLVDNISSKHNNESEFKKI